MLRQAGERDRLRDVTDPARATAPLQPPRISLPPAWWGVAAPGDVPPFRPLTALVADGVLDAELAGLLWLLVEAGVPVMVAGPRGSGRTTLLTALLAVLPADTKPLLLAGADEDFTAIPEAVELGWRRERGGDAKEPAGPRPAPHHTSLLAAEVGDRPPLGVWGDRARVAIRALALGYGFGATIEAGGLDDVLTLLRGPDVAAGADELAGLGLVVAMAPRAADAAPRVAVAHYVRPLVRDPGGHVQRLLPAVLAARDVRSGTWSHFAWGLSDELGGRVGRRPLDLEREQARRAAVILAASHDAPGG